MNYRQLSNFVTELNNQIKKQQVSEQDTKVSQKLAKIGSKFQSNIDEFNEKLEEIRIDNASVDEKNIILKDEKGAYKFSKEGLKNLLVQTKELNEKEFSFKKVEITNPLGLEEFLFLEGWVSGITFIKEEEL
jgi:hypothetical protein